MPAIAHRQHRLTGFVLVMLLLLTQVVTASEGPTHALCETAGCALIVESPLGHGDSEHQPDVDLDALEHICHVHPPAHGLAGTLETPVAERLATLFLPFLVALNEITTSPPVPPPNA